MLLSSFNIIKQHFSPTSVINRNIFITKQYEYPSPFIQKLYLSYLELQQLFKTKPIEQIAKKINIVSNKNDKSFQKVIIGLAYALMFYCSRIKANQNQQKDKSKILQSNTDQRYYEQKFVNQVYQILTYFRNQAWTLFNNIILQLVSNYFFEIKQSHRFSFISIFKRLLKYSTCSDDLFISIMKTLNFYDHKNWALKYNLQLFQQFNQIIVAWRKSNTEPGGMMIPSQQKNYSKAKLNEQISLMRHYLFGKLVHWQYMNNKMTSYMKGQLSYNIQKASNQGLKMLKALYASSPQQCLVFSSELCRYADYYCNDKELSQILKRICEQSHKAINPQLIGHHYSLVPISIQFLIPAQIQQSISQMNRTLYGPQPDSSGMRVEKTNVHMIMTWLWKQLTLNYSQQNNKNYLLQNVYQDLIRWCLLSHTKNMELRSFVIEWVMYNSMQNQSLNKSVKQAYFNDWIYYLKIAQNINFNDFYPILTTSLHMLNYFVFCAPAVGQMLLVYLLGRNINLKTSYQSGNLNQGTYRIYINQILKRSTQQGIIRIRQIIYQSQINNYIKNELQMRIYQASTAGIQTLNINKQVTIHNQESIIKQKSNQYAAQQPTDKYYKPYYEDNKIIQEEKPQYYGDKKLEIAFDIKDQQFGRNNSVNDDQDDILYTSHQLIPSSPSYQSIQHPSCQYLEDAQVFNLQRKQSLKRENSVPSYQLQKQISNRNQPLLQKNKSTQFNPSKILDNPEIIKKQSNKSIQPKPQLQKKKSILQKPKTYEIKLQKQFLQQMGPSIQQLLKSPTIIQFTQYMKQLIKALKQYKKSNQQQMIQKFLKQTSKIIYVVFNKQFQSFDFNVEGKNVQNKQSHFITYFLLKSIHQHWKQALVIYNVFIYKKLVKYLCEAFPSCQFAFYYVYLDIFKKGVPNYREMKPWLIPSERDKCTIPILQKLLGNRFKMHIYENAQVLKLIQ